jgi:hypothetical protein
MTTSTMRFMAVVVGALVGGLLLAAAVSAAMRANATPPTILAPQSAVREPQRNDRGRDAVPVTPATTAPEPAVDVDQDEPEPGHDRGRDRGDGHGSSGGPGRGGDRDGGRG